MDVISGRSYSFKQLKDLTHRLSSALVKRGFKKNEVLAIYLPNMIEYPIVFYGVAFIGGVCTTVNPLYSAQELARQLWMSGAKYLVTIPPLAEAAKDAAASEGVRSVFVIGDAVQGCESLLDLLADDGTAFPEQMDINPKEDLVGLSLFFAFIISLENKPLSPSVPLVRAGRFMKQGHQLTFARSSQTRQFLSSRTANMIFSDPQFQVVDPGIKTVTSYSIISLYFFPRTIFSSSPRLVRYTDKCMKSSKHDWTLSGTATSLQFFSKNPSPSAKSFQFMNFSEAMFHEYYLISDFHTNTVISRLVCLLVKMASKIVIRPIGHCWKMTDAQIYQ